MRTVLAITMKGETDDSQYCTCPPVRPPRRSDLCDLLGLADPEEVDLKDVKTYEEYDTKYFDNHGVEKEDRPSWIEEYDGDHPIDKEFVKNHESPVGQIRWKNEIEQLEGTSADLSKYAGLPEGSGTLIDAGTLTDGLEDLFLTVGHSFVIDGGPPPADVAEQMHVTFGYQYDRHGDLNEGESYPVKSLVEHEFRHAGLDYAILELGDNPAADYGTAEVAWGDAQQDEPLCIIGHPNGCPKRVVAGHRGHLHDVRIGYDDINTAPGSSGAGILDGTGKLVGVHSESGFGINEGHNHGIRISAILAASRTLRTIVEGPYMYESHSALLDSHSALLDSPRTPEESDGESKGGPKQTGDVTQSYRKPPR